MVLRCLLYIIDVSGNNFLVIVDHDAVDGPKLYELDLSRSPSRVRQVSINLNAELMGVAYDNTTGIIYWTDNSDNTVYKYIQPTAAVSAVYTDTTG